MQNRIYWNNSNNNMQKGIALATCMAIVMGLFTGCGNKNDQQIAASPDEVQKGRYVETELSPSGGMEGQKYQPDFPFR